MKIKFKDFLYESKSPMKCTVVILELHNVHNIEHLYRGKLRELLNLFKDKVAELNEKHGDRFILPIDCVGFSTEAAIKGKDFELANHIAQELYDTLKNFSNKLIVKVGVGYGDIEFIGRKLHESDGPAFWKVGRSIDKRTSDGIIIIKGDWTRENQKHSKLKERFAEVGLNEDEINKMLDLIDEFNFDQCKETYINLMNYTEDVLQKIKEDDRDYFLSQIWQETKLEYVDDPDELFDIKWRNRQMI